jgi:Holliday junction resolvase RusA-like endonuclease
MPEQHPRDDPGWTQHGNPGERSETIRLRLEGVPWSGNIRKRSHHMALYRHDRVWRAASGILAGDARRKHRNPSIPWQFPWHKAAVTITFRFAKSSRRDVDNYTAACKGILDGLKDGGLIVDDDTTHMTLAVVLEVDRINGPSTIVEVTRG